MREGKRGQRSARTIVHSFRVLQAALKLAVKKGKLACNVTDRTDPPKTKKAKVAISDGGQGSRRPGSIEGQQDLPDSRPGPFDRGTPL